MCGILGAAAERPIIESLIEGLKRLEYRGYDSAGLAVVNMAHANYLIAPILFSIPLQFLLIEL